MYYIGQIAEWKNWESLNVLERGLIAALKHEHDLEQIYIWLASHTSSPFRIERLYDHKLVLIYNNYKIVRQDTLQIHFEHAIWTLRKLRSKAHMSYSSRVKVKKSIEIRPDIIKIILDEMKVDCTYYTITGHPSVNGNICLNGYARTRSILLVCKRVMPNMPKDIIKMITDLVHGRKPHWYKKIIGETDDAD